MGSYSNDLPLNEIFPNEVKRMFLEHLDQRQRLAVSRVCHIWYYLVATFPRIPKGYTFRKKFGAYGTGEGEFNSPCSAAIDPNSHNILVADYGNSRIQVFDEEGRYQFQFGHSGRRDGQLASPCDVKIDPNDGSIVVADFGNDRVQIFEPNGDFRRKIEPIRGPRGVAIDHQSNIYVAAWGNHDISKFDQNGRLLLRFGSMGQNLDQFENPSSVIVDERTGNILVADRFGFQIKIFDSEGNFLFRFGSEGRENNQFQGPMAVSLTSSGVILVNDNNSNQIKAFCREGSFLFKFGSRGNGDGQFSSLQGFDINRSNDEIIVPTWGNSNVQILTPIY
jgi:DNA-binding beta-propeller fold protein YncE